MAETPDYERGSGPEQLPKGAAQDANEAKEASEDMRESGGIQEDLLAGVQFVDPVQEGQAAIAAGKPVGEDEEFLYQPTQQPETPVTGPGYGRGLPMPREIQDIIPLLDDLVGDPDETGTINALRNLIAYHLAE